VRIRLSCASQQELEHAHMHAVAPTNMATCSRVMVHAWMHAWMYAYMHTCMYGGAQAKIMPALTASLPVVRCCWAEPVRSLVRDWWLLTKMPSRPDSIGQACMHDMRACMRECQSLLVWKVEHGKVGERHVHMRVLLSALRCASHTANTHRFPTLQHTTWVLH
jgi:hypothetical protein